VPLPQAVQDATNARRANVEERAGGDRLRALLWTALACVGWAALGLGCLMWAAHTTDIQLGWIAVWLGLAVGNGGILFTLLWAYARGEHRGDW
jgi:hypothetical protein